MKETLWSDFFLLFVAYMPQTNYICFAAQMRAVVALCPETAGSSHIYQVEDGYLFGNWITFVCWWFFLPFPSL